MSKRKCGRCGRDPADGYAQVNDTFYCHGDGPPLEDDWGTCYEMVSLMNMQSLRIAGFDT